MFSWQIAGPGPAAEATAAVAIAGIEAEVFTAILDHNYSLFSALAGLVVAGAVATGTAMAILRRTHPSSGVGGPKPPRSA